MHQGPFMMKELSKAIMTRSRITNNYHKWPSRENFLAMKRAKNTCNILAKSTKKEYFKKVTQKGFANNNVFWNTVKPFLTLFWLGFFMDVRWLGGGKNYPPWLKPVIFMRLTPNLARLSYGTQSFKK